MNTQNKAVYAETMNVFLEDVKSNNYIEKMKFMSNENGFCPQDPEINSWTENSSALKSLFIKAEIPKDVVVAFEYHAPVGGRVDCMLFGQDDDNNNNVVVIELKGWKTATQCCENKLVNTFTGGSCQDVLHPSHQVEEYHRQFNDFIKLFEKPNFCLTSLAYCYNYEKSEKNNALYHSKFDSVSKEYKLYAKNDVEILAKELKSLLSKGKGKDIFTAVSGCQPFPTEKLIDSAANIIIDKDNFHLLGEQSVAYEKILTIIDDAINNDEKCVFVVKGGPGTGKTLVALKVMSAMAKKKITSMYATRSTALRDDLKRALSATAINGKNASNLIQDIYKFRPSQYYENQIDVLFVDEAHRIAESANADKTGRYSVVVEHEGTGNPYCPLSQTTSLIYCSRVTVFFIDDNQAVQSSEVGQSEKILEIAARYQKQISMELEKFHKLMAKKEKTREKYIAEKKDIDQNILIFSDDEFNKKLGKWNKKFNQITRELTWKDGLKNIKNKYTGNVRVGSIQLKTQFRCSGGDKFVAWLDEVLYKKPNEIQLRLKKEDFDFHIYNNPNDLYNKIKQLNKADNKTARLCAGWCWPWSNKQIDLETGDLKKEVMIGDSFKMPWETRQCPKKEPYKSLYAPDTNSWMSHPMGINQIGCIHTAQGFEFDYVGVIIGPDLVYDKQNDCLKCIREKNTEGKRHMNAKNENILIRNIYRVLLSRGKYGCYIFTCDPEVANYLKRFIKM